MSRLRAEALRGCGGLGYGLAKGAQARGEMEGCDGGGPFGRLVVVVVLWGRGTVGQWDSRGPLAQAQKLAQTLALTLSVCLSVCSSVCLFCLHSGTLAYSGTSRALRDTRARLAARMTGAMCESRIESNRIESRGDPNR